MILFHYITCSPFFMGLWYFYNIISHFFYTNLLCYFYLFIVCHSRAFKKELKKSLWQYSCGVCCSFIFLIYLCWNYQKKKIIRKIDECLFNSYFKLSLFLYIYIYIYIFLLLLVFIGLRSWSKNNFFCLW